MGDTTDDTTDDREISYWPLLRAALVAALVTLAAQVIGTVWFGLQAGARVELDLFYVLPYLKIVTTSIAVFNTIIKWSTIFTALAATVFVVEAFVRRRRLQTQTGRAFAFLDLAVLAGLHLWGERITPGAVLPTRIMVYVLAFGLIGFAVSLFLVNDSYRLRTSDSTDRHAPATDLPATDVAPS